MIVVPATSSTSRSRTSGRLASAGFQTGCAGASAARSPSAKSRDVSSPVQADGSRRTRSRDWPLASGSRPRQPRARRRRVRDDAESRHVSARRRKRSCHLEGLRVAARRAGVCRLPNSNFQLPTPNCQLPISNSSSNSRGAAPRAEMGLRVGRLGVGRWQLDVGSCSDWLIATWPK